jgi:hypothetical protein
MDDSSGIFTGLGPTISDAGFVGVKIHAEILAGRAESSVTREILGNRMDTHSPGGITGSSTFCPITPARAP